MLRGIINSGADHVSSLTLSFSVRRLDGDDVQRNESSLMFIAIIVGFICFFYLVCTFQCMRIWCCSFCGNASSPANSTEGGGGGEGADTVLVHEGRVFNLTGDQRRAVLETIFSETSKPATDQDVSKKKKRIARDDDDYCHDVPHDVEIPQISTTGTEISKETDSPGSVGGGGGDNNSASQGMVSSMGDKADEADFEIISDDEVETVGESSPLPSPYYTSPESLARSCNSDEHVRTPSVSNFSPSQDNNGISNNTDSGAIPFIPDEAGVADNIDDPIQALPMKPRPKSAETDLALEASNVLGHSTSSLPPAASAAELEEGASEEAVGRMEAPEQQVESDSTSSIPVFPELNSSARSKINSSFVIPEDVVAEETKEEIGADDENENDDDIEPSLSSTLHMPHPPLHRESFTAASVASAEYTYDDETATTTTDNVCPICISGYHLGDVLVSSKYCTHSFHKDCILEWLAKHNDCPVCRTGMVTDSELNQAATEFKGKTRMYRAVATLSSTTPHLRHHNPRSLSPPRTLMR